MTVARLIELLKNANQDSEVFAFDADAEELMPVSGALFDEFRIELQTDEQD